MDIVAGLNTAKSIKKFVEGSMVDVLYNIEMKAAGDALKRVDFAKDVRSQLWSVINHLETAEAAARSVLDGHAKYTSLWNFDMAQINARNAIACRAICYKYLGETPLMEQCIHDIKLIDNMDAVPATIFTPLIVSHAVTGLAGMLKSLPRTYRNGLDEVLRFDSSDLERWLRDEIT